jgi:Flp pilus assembly protein TadG
VRLHRSGLRSEDGVAALEFAILAPIFFLLLLALIDMSLFFATHSIVDKSVENAARAVRLGSLQADKDGSGFRATLCQDLFFVDCNKFSFSVVATNDLSTISSKPTLDGNGMIAGATYDPGKPEEFVVVTIVYVYQFIIPWIGDLLGDDGLNDPRSRAITSFLVIKNEPYPD